MEPKQLSTTKTIAVVAIVIGCFAVLYPRFFHPMWSKMMGNSPSQADETEKDFVPQHMRQPHRPDTASHPRSGPHPGMRTAAEMKAQQQSGPGRGMMGIILPMYAVGIVLYLIYTLVKVFSKREEHKASALGKNNALKNKFSYSDGKFQYRDDISDNDAYRDYMRRKYAEKIDAHEGYSVEEREMAELQKRLMETEAQMSRILDAMKNISSSVDTAVDSKDDTTDAGMVDASSHSPQVTDIEDKSNPTPETFDILDKSLPSANRMSLMHDYPETIGTMETDAMETGNTAGGYESESYSDEEISRDPAYLDGSDGSSSGEDEGDIIEELASCREKMMKIEENMVQKENVRCRRVVKLSDE